MRSTLLLAMLVGSGAAPLHDAVLEQKGEVDWRNFQGEIDALDDNSMTALQLACYTGKHQAALGLVQAGASLEAQSAIDGMRPLHWAAGQGHLRVVRVLLDAGAQVDAGDGSGRTSLHYASARDSVHTLELLLGAGASPAALTMRGISPLQLAAEKGHTAAIGVLLGAGADIEAAADEGRMRPLHGAAATGHARAIVALLAAGAEIGARDARERTALHVAATRGQLEAVAALLEAGAPLDSVDIQGLTPLRAAARAKQSGARRAIAKAARARMRQNSALASEWSRMRSRLHDGFLGSMATKATRACAAVVGAPVRLGRRIGRGVRARFVQANRSEESEGSQ